MRQTIKPLAPLLRLLQSVCMKEQNYCSVTTQLCFTRASKPLESKDMVFLDFNCFRWPKLRKEIERGRVDMSFAFSIAMYFIDPKQH